MLPARFQHRRVYTRLSIATACLLAIALMPVGWRFDARRPRAWAAADVPVAFWAWRNETPREGEVERVVQETHAGVLFLRAGQIHYENGVFSRVRAVTGRFPRGVELHLVYNGTRALLAEFEHLDPIKLAALVYETYTQDAARAAQDGARVAGLQLDLDAPTRLLSHYARILRATRERLPRALKLSVTGLPTWVESRVLMEVLDAVDFWIPQCYGAVIPEKLSQVFSISSPEMVARDVARARELGRPFYAGLSAYGYAILYDVRGTLLALRGDLDPALIALDSNFELVERRPFIAQAQTAPEEQRNASEWRYVYHARADTVVDDLVVHEGESLMLDVPSAETLRQAARAARAEAGEKLLGVCVFRLPGEDDPSTLPVEQVAAALKDTMPIASTAVRVEPIATDSVSMKDQAHGLLLTATNQGTASALMGDDALVIDLSVPAGTARVLRLEGFNAVETLCDGENSNVSEDEARPCAERRANILRLSAKTWATGASAHAYLSFDEKPPQSLAARVRVRTDDGRAWQQQQQITISNGEER